MVFIQVITNQPGFSVLNTPPPPPPQKKKNKKQKTTCAITCSNQISSRKLCMASIRVITLQPGISILKPRKTAYIITCSNKISSRKILHGIHSSNNKPTRIFSFNTQEKTTYTITCSNKISSRKFCMASIRVITH